MYKVERDSTCIASESQEMLVNGLIFTFLSSR